MAHALGRPKVDLGTEPLTRDTSSTPERVFRRTGLISLVDRYRIRPKLIVVPVQLRLALG